MEQETLVLIKPDGVAKNLIGSIIKRFERVGFKIVELKMLEVDESLAGKHYPVTKEWATATTARTVESYKKKGLTPPPVTSDPMKYGSLLQSWLKKMITAGPIVAMVVRGNNAIDVTRKIVGATEPKSAAPGTIRGDFGNESYEDSDREKRVINNLIHASDSEETAKKEIALWFPKRTS